MKFNTTYVNWFGLLFINEEHELTCSCPINIIAYIGTPGASSASILFYFQLCVPLQKNKVK